MINEAFQELLQAAFVSEQVQLHPAASAQSLHTREEGAGWQGVLQGGQDKQLACALCRTEGFKHLTSFGSSLI